jgi:hypothetical protein
MEEPTELKLHCLFCSSTSFNLPDDDYSPKPRERIQCTNCGKMNDYDSLMRIAKRKGMEWAEAQAKKEIEKFKKNLVKMFR